MNHFDEFFIGLKTFMSLQLAKKPLLQRITDNEPKTDFEKLIYLGYQIIRPAPKIPVST